MSYRIVVKESVIEVANEKELGIALRKLNAQETGPASESDVSKRIQRRLREIAKPADASPSLHLADFAEESQGPSLGVAQARTPA